MNKSVENYIFGIYFKQLRTYFCELQENEIQRSSLLKRINELEFLLRKEREASSLIGRRLGTERQRVFNHKQTIQGLQSRVSELEEDLCITQDDNDKFHEKADKMSAKFDSTVLLLQSVAKNAQIFNASPEFCEICWQFNQEFFYNCGHGVCFRCASELVFRGMLRPFLKIQLPNPKNII